MNKLAIALLAAGLHANAAPPAALATPASLVPAKLQPATGLDVARGVLPENWSRWYESFEGAKGA